MDGLNKIFPVPDLGGSRKLLCIQPHPDDMDIAAGGTIALLAEAGVSIAYLTLTDDTAGFTMDFGKKSIPIDERKEIRRNEQVNAGKILGVSDYYWLDFPDAGDWSVYDARNKIIKYIRLYRPDFIMTVDPWLHYEAHRDHIKCGLAASEALLLYNFSHIKSDETIDANYKPYDIDGIAYCITREINTVIDTERYKGIKIDAVGAHKSQFSPDSLAEFKAYDEFRGTKIAKGKDFPYGEGFKVLKPEMLHIASECMRGV